MKGFLEILFFFTVIYKCQSVAYNDPRLNTYGRITLDKENPNRFEYRSFAENGESGTENADNQNRVVKEPAKLITRIGSLNTRQKDISKSNPKNELISSPNKKDTKKVESVTESINRKQFKSNYAVPISATISFSKFQGRNKTNSVISGESNLLYVNKGILPMPMYKPPLHGGSSNKQDVFEINDLDFDEDHQVETDDELNEIRKVEDVLSPLRQELTLLEIDRVLAKQNNQRYDQQNLYGPPQNNQRYDQQNLYDSPQNNQRYDQHNLYDSPQNNQRYDQQNLYGSPIIGDIEKTKNNVLTTLKKLVVYTEKRRNNRENFKRKNIRPAPNGLQPTRRPHYSINNGEEQIFTPNGGVDSNYLKELLKSQQVQQFLQENGYPQ